MVAALGRPYQGPAAGQAAYTRQEHDLHAFLVWTRRSVTFHVFLLSQNLPLRMCQPFNASDVPAGKRTRLRGRKSLRDLHNIASAGSHQSFRLVRSSSATSNRQPISHSHFHQPFSPTTAWLPIYGVDLRRKSLRDQSQEQRPPDPVVHRRLHSSSSHDVIALTFHRRHPLKAGNGRLDSRKQAKAEDLCDELPPPPPQLRQFPRPICSLSSVVLSVNMLFPNPPRENLQRSTRRSSQ